MMTRTLKTLLEKVKEHRSGRRLYLTDASSTYTQMYSYKVISSSLCMGHHLCLN